MRIKCLQVHLKLLWESGMLVMVEMSASIAVSRRNRLLFPQYKKAGVGVQIRTIEYFHTQAKVVRGKVIPK